PLHLGGGEARIFGVEDALEMRRKSESHYFFGSATIMSSSTRAPGELSWLTHNVVLAGRQPPKQGAIAACMPSKSRMSVRYFVTFTTSRKLAPTWSRLSVFE